jgi:signal transduction histidine kinase
VIDQKNITLETAEPAAGLVVRGDPNRLEQAVQNLVSNAARHTPVGGRIVVSAVRKEDGVVLSVEDTGPGIPPEHLPRIFDRFYKVDVSRTGTALPSGSGLGLSIVRAIVERHGGRISASNAPAGGARFEIWLPQAG